MARKFKRYNNGVENIIVYEGDPVPEGYVKGMLVPDEVKRKRVEKAKKTNLERYGVANAMQSQKIVDRLKNSNLEKYGATCTLHSKVIEEKTKKTNLERYGTEYYFQSNDFKDRYKEIMQEKYGVDNAFQAEEVKEKIRQTNIENLGVPYPMMSEEILDKSRKTSLEVYGTEYPNQSDIVKQHIVEACLEKYGTEHPAQSKYVRDKTIKTNRERYGVDWTCITQDARGHIHNDSKPNREFAELLESNGIKYEREFPLEHYSYDFKVGGNLIEIDPSPTHNNLWTPFDEEKGIPKDYHQKKSQTAEEAGFRVIHIFDWNDSMKVVEFLKDKEKVYARKCDIREVSIEDCDNFLNMYHLQNTCKGQDIRLGLYYNEELISIMTFGKPRYNKNYQYELLRYASKLSVTGGSLKIFKHFVRTYKPESIVSYCDRSKFTGVTYKILGFRLSNRGTPACHWYSMKEDMHITDNLLRQMGYDRLFNEHYGKGTSNVELIIKRGFLPIYDCGQDTYVWESEL